MWAANSLEHRIGGALNGGLALEMRMPGKHQFLTHSRQVGQHLLPDWAVVQNLLEFGGDAVRREIVLQEFGNNLPAGDEVGHGDMGYLDQAAGSEKRER